MKEILLYSGGMDSYIAWHYLRKPKTLFANLGHRYRFKEFEAVIKTIPKTKIMEMSTIGKYEEDDANIPLRNLYLSMLAVNEGASKVWMIVQKDEMSIPDRSHEFFSSSSKLLTFLAEREVKVSSPFCHMDKTEMVGWFVKNINDVKGLLSTVGCFSSEEGHCGNCGSCFRRYVALMNNNIHPGYELQEEIKIYYLNRLHKYPIERQDRMRQWLI